MLACDLWSCMTGLISEVVRACAFMIVMGFIFSPLAGTLVSLRGPVSHWSSPVWLSPTYAITADRVRRRVFQPSGIQTGGLPVIVRRRLFLKPGVFNCRGGSSSSGTCFFHDVFATFRVQHVIQAAWDYGA